MWNQSIAKVGWMIGARIILFKQRVVSLGSHVCTLVKVEATTAFCIHGVNLLDQGEDMISPNDT